MRNPAAVRFVTQTHELATLMLLKKFQEQIFFATVRITKPTEKSAGTSIGTGFLYQMPISEERECIFLISNRHVYGDPNQPIQLVFNQRNPEKMEEPLLGQIVVAEDSQFDHVYTAHPDETIDLACINVSMIGNHKPPIFYKCINSNLLVNFEHEYFLPGNEIWFVGYPENRFDTKNNLPVLRRGYIASIPSVNFEGRPELLIDAQVYPGSSGSPVFTELDGHFKLIGVIAQTIIRNEKLQAVPVGSSLGIQQVIGLGILLKSSLIGPMLDAALAKIRDQMGKVLPKPSYQENRDGDKI